MLEKLSERFTEKLVSLGIVQKEDAEIYSFGFFQLFIMLINVVTTIFLGVVFCQFWQCLLLNASYIPIRMCAGGHHASSPVKCYLSSTVMIAGLLVLVRWVSINLWISGGLILISSVVIAILSPVETENNPLDEVEKHVYRMRTYIVLGIEIAVTIVTLCLHINVAAKIIALGLSTEAVMSIVGKIECLQRKKLQSLSFKIRGGK